MIIAAEVDGSLRLTSGPAIQHAGDLAAILSSLEEGDVLFIDEIHRLARTAEEMLYLAMEDFRVDIVVGKGRGPPPSLCRCRPSPSSAPPRGRGFCQPRCGTASVSPGTWTTTGRASSLGSSRAARACWG